MKKIIAVQKKKAAVLLITISVIVLLTVFLAFKQSHILKRAFSLQRNSTMEIFFEKKQYSGLYRDTVKNLEKHPLDEKTILFKGLSSFYLSLEQISREQKDLYLDSAIYSFRQYIQLKPDLDSEIIHYFLGKAYLMKGFYYSDLAISHLMNAYIAGYRPEDMDELLGEAYFSSGDYDKSLDYFSRYIEKNPVSEIFLKMSESAFYLKKTEQSLQFLKQGLKLTKDQTIYEQGLFKLAYLYYDGNQYNEAEKYINDYIELNDNDPEAYFLKGEIYYSLGNIRLARKNWHIAARLNPRHKPALHRLYD